MRKIKIKRFDKELPLPEYKTLGAAGFDLRARKTVIIQKNTVGYVPLNIAIETPKDYFLVLAVRSSTHKMGLMPANGIGIGDSDYRGDDDEYKITLLNFTNKPVVIERGTRIAQGLFVKHVKARWHEVPKMRSRTRGGFGSTGKK